MVRQAAVGMAVALFSLLLISNDSLAQTQAQNPAPTESMPADAPTVEVEYGSRRPIIDGVGWVFGIPRKVLMWDQRADNHSVSEETVGEVAGYLQERGLQDVKVRVNQYAPGQEWKRLTQNKNIGAGWRYTLGTLKCLEYTLVPGRLFGHDQYNPYTNSLYLYSDMPALGLAESAYAKDVQHRKYPGTYAAVQSLPIVAMWHETLATGEVLEYVSLRGSAEEQEKIRRDLYARYGIELGGEFGRLLPDGSTLFPIVGALGGHGVATYNNQRPAEQQNTVPLQPTSYRPPVKATWRR